MEISCFIYIKNVFIVVCYSQLEWLEWDPKNERFATVRRISSVLIIKIYSKHNVIFNVMQLFCKEYEIIVSTKYKSN